MTIKSHTTETQIELLKKKLKEQGDQFIKEVTLYMENYMQKERKRKFINYRKDSPEQMIRLRELTWKLRERTGRGLMVCRRTLIQSKLCIQKAQKLLQCDQRYSFKNNYGS